MLAYGLWAWTIIGLLGPFVWLAVLLLPKLSWRWNVTRMAVIVLRHALFLRVETTGTWPAPPAVLVANHASFIDTFALFLSLKEPIVFVAGGKLASQRIAGPFLRRLGCVFVKTEAKERASETMSTFRSVLAGGGSLLAFPEGGIAIDRLGRFHLGAFLLAVQTRSPVVPVAIAGTRAVLPFGVRLPLRQPIQIVIGDPIVTEDKSWKGAHQLAERSRSLVVAMLELASREL